MHPGRSASPAHRSDVPGRTPRRAACLHPRPPADSRANRPVQPGDQSSTSGQHARHTRQPRARNSNRLRLEQQEPGPVDPGLGRQRTGRPVAGGTGHGPIDESARTQLAEFQKQIRKDDGQGTRVPAPLSPPPRVPRSAAGFPSRPVGLPGTARPWKTATATACCPTAPTCSPSHPTASSRPSSSSTRATATTWFLPRRPWGFAGHLQPRRADHHDRFFPTTSGRPGPGSVPGDQNHVKQRIKPCHPPGRPASGYPTRRSARPSPRPLRLSVAVTEYRRRAIAR